MKNEGFWYLQPKQERIPKAATQIYIWTTMRRKEVEP